MKNTLRKLSVISLILLSACAVSNQQIVAPTVDPIPTVASTQTRTEIVSSPTPTITVIVQTPTKDYTALLSRLLPNCGNSELSPNQTWATGFCNTDETWVVGVDQQAKWSVSYGEYYGKKFDSGNGVIAPYHWTSDNKYLDLVIQRGASGPIYFGDGWGLIRLDLANGNLAEILNPVQHHYYSFSFSPDEKSLAYILQPATPLAVKIIDLESKDVKSYLLKPEHNQAGEILWSPDMSKIVLGQATIDEEETKPNIFSVVLINLADDSRQMVVSNSSVQMRAQKWIDENKIELSDEDGKTWIFNLIDQTLVEKTQ
jgi:hypothetical protein